jgi:hypothetical protein
MPAGHRSGGVRLTGRRQWFDEPVELGATVHAFAVPLDPRTVRDEPQRRLDVDIVGFKVIEGQPDEHGDHIILPLEVPRRCRIRHDAEPIKILIGAFHTPSPTRGGAVDATVTVGFVSNDGSTTYQLDAPVEARRFGSGRFSPADSAEQGVDGDVRGAGGIVPVELLGEHGDDLVQEGLGHPVG